MINTVVSFFVTPRTLESSLAVYLNKSSVHWRGGPVCDSVHWNGKYIGGADVYYSC